MTVIMTGSTAMKLAESFRGPVGSDLLSRLSRLQNQSDGSDLQARVVDWCGGAPEEAELRSRLEMNGIRRNEFHEDGKQAKPPVSSEGSPAMENLTSLLERLDTGLSQSADSGARSMMKSIFEGPADAFDPETVLQQIRKEAVEKGFPDPSKGPSPLTVFLESVQSSRSGQVKILTSMQRVPLSLSMASGARPLALYGSHTVSAPEFSSSSQAPQGTGTATQNQKDSDEDNLEKEVQYSSGGHQDDEHEEEEGEEKPVEAEKEGAEVRSPKDILQEESSGDSAGNE